MHLGRLVDGKVVEHWGVVDQMGMMNALDYKVDIEVPA